MFQGFLSNGLKKIGRQSQVIEQDAGSPVDAVGGEQPLRGEIDHSLIQQTGVEVDDAWPG